MALIKTDNQNYTDIANAIKEIGGIKTLFNEEIEITKYSSISKRYYLYSDYEYFVENYMDRVGEVFEVILNNVSYTCELKKHIIGNGNIMYYLGNLYVVYSDGNDFPDTGEPFGISITLWSPTVNFDSLISGTHHFIINKKYYKPSEMKPALDEIVPDYGVSYDTFDSNGNVLTASTYGYKVTGFAGTEYLQSVNISNKATEIGDYAFKGSKIKSLSLPNGITKIGESAFGNYLENIILPDTLTEIGSFSFGGCWYLGLHTLPDSVVTIESYAFFNMGYYVNKETYNEFIIPKNVDFIGSSAFKSTPYVTFTFKGTPSSISNNIFDTNVTTINVPWSEGEVDKAPWGATNATINYNYITE